MPVKTAPSIHLAVFTKQLKNHREEFHEICYWAVLIEFVDIFHFWLTSDKILDPLHECLHALMCTLNSTRA
jgi:hypothetical protein